MAITVYNYSIADDTANGKVAPRNLDQEIRDDLTITKELAGVTISGNDLDISFQAALDVTEESALDSIVAAHTGVVTIKAPERVSPSGVPLTMPQWREGNPTDFITFNWCDKTSWYAASTRVTNEVLTDSGDGLTFTSANPYWVSVTQGKISQEHRLVSAYGAVITVNDVAKIESSPGTTDGDYQINYDTGAITFNSSQAGNTVKATYSYVTTADFYIEPKSGTTIRLTAVEVQFSADVGLTDSVRFDIEGFVEYFAPQMVDDVNPDYVTTFPSGTRIPLGSPRIYKTMYDFIAEAQRAYPVIPALGGNTWRGMSQDVYVLRWPYQEDATRDLSADKGMRIKVSLENNTPFQGAYAVATFYAVSVNDS